LARYSLFVLKVTLNPQANKQTNHFNGHFPGEPGLAGV